VLKLKQRISCRIESVIKLIERALTRACVWSRGKDIPLRAEHGLMPDEGSNDGLQLVETHAGVMWPATIRTVAVVVSAASAPSDAQMT
jgi:hypothetical protein